MRPMPIIYPIKMYKKQKHCACFLFSSTYNRKYSKHGMTRVKKRTYWHFNFDSWLLKLTRSSAICCTAWSWFSSYSRMFATPTDLLKSRYIRSTISLILLSNLLISAFLLSIPFFNYNRNNISLDQWKVSLPFKSVYIYITLQLELQNRLTSGHNITFWSSGLIRSISSFIISLSCLKLASLSSILRCNNIS